MMYRSGAGDKKDGLSKSRAEKIFRYLDVLEDFLAHNRDIFAEILSEIPRLISSRVSELVIRVRMGCDIAYREKMIPLLPI